MNKRRSITLFNLLFVTIQAPNINGSSTGGLPVVATVTNTVLTTRPKVTAPKPYEIVKSRDNSNPHRLNGITRERLRILRSSQGNTRR